MARLYLQDILLPQEQVLYRAKVHYILYLPGVIFLTLAWLTMAYMPDIVWAVGVSHEAWETINGVFKFISISSFMAGTAMLLRAWLNIYSTEMLITDLRVLVKVGISTATTAEIDRNRISSVIVTKPLVGRMLDYGWITILGYSSNIGGLPVMARPHEIQKHIYQSAYAR